MIDQDDRAVSVRLCSKGTGARILLLHGLGENDSVWNRSVEELADDYEIWSARLPWRAGGPAGWGRDTDLGSRLFEAIELVPSGPLIVVAHSMTANVLLELLDRRDRLGDDLITRFGIRGLIIVSPFYRRTADEFDWDSITHYLNRFHLILEEGLRVHSNGRLPADIQSAMALLAQDRIGPYGWSEFFNLYLRTPELETARITVQCLVISGENDFAAPSSEGTVLAAVLPDADLRVLPGSGHFPMLEEPQAFASLVRNFVNAIGTVAPQPGAIHLSTQEQLR